MKKKRTSSVSTKLAAATRAAAKSKFNATPATKIKAAVGKAIFTTKRRKK